MNSPIFENLGIDPAIIIAVLAALTIVLIVLVVILALRCKKVFGRYEMFMKGKTAADLEEILAQICDRVLNLEDQDRANKDVLKVLNRSLINSYQKTGLVKYNAFEGMGGATSFALALLDLNDNGIILNVIHSRNACYTYIKDIKKGECDVLLGDEEKGALDEAKQRKNRFYTKDEPDETQDEMMKG